MSGREQAQKQFFSSAYPTTKEPEWRHVRLDNYDSAHLHLGPVQYDVGHDVGIIVEHLREPQQQSGHPTTRFRSLHDSFWVKGLRVVITPQFKAKKPLIITVAMGAGTVLPHLEIELQEGSQATVIERFLGAKDTTLTSSTSSISLRADSELTFISDSDAMNHTHFHHQLYTLDQSSRLAALTFQHATALQHYETEAVLRGAGAEANLAGLLLGSKNSELIAKTVQSHSHPHTVSDLHYYSVLTDEARTHFSGLIKIAVGADGSNAYQKNSNLLLQNTARAYTTPKLEIEANDVRCTHGATSGPLDPEQVLYAKSRGLDEKDARQLLVGGFLEQSTRAISDRGARDYISKRLIRQLAELGRSL